MATSLSTTEQATWKSFLSANVRLIEQLDHELQQRSHLSLTDYEILDALSKAKSQKLRMSELANEVLVSRSRLTYRVDRLANAQFIDREECRYDRRGLWATLTPKGKEALDSAVAGHTNDVRTWFFDNLNESEVEVLGKAMSRVQEKLLANK